MAQKCLVLLTMMLYCVCFTNGVPFNLTDRLTEDTHDIRQCPIPALNADTALCDFNYMATGHFFGYVSQTIHCPRSGNNKKRINCIIVTNLDDNDKGGYPFIIDGGLNDFTVDIYLKSQWGRGLNFHIEAYTTKT